MNVNDKYWIWLSNALGAGARVDEILSAFDSPRSIYEADGYTRLISGVFTKAQYDKLAATPLENAEETVAVCEKHGWHILTPDCEEYPRKLRNLVDMPLVLYANGDVSLLNEEITVGVVGTRHPCRESVIIAHTICAQMTAKGALIISGGALGIDSAAHEGALDAGGKTVCVLGCGLGTDYLRINEPLRRRISKSGVLVTEYPPFSPVGRASFPLRNRIISGLSLGVLVVEAGEKSGSLITARCANEQGRDVFAIPGSILTTAYSGANKLIKDGAMAVTCAEDVLESYSVMYPELIDLRAKTVFNRSEPEPPAKPVFSKKADPPAQIKTKKTAPDTVSPDAAAVYAVFGAEPVHVDEICVKTGLAPSKVLSALTELELEDCIEPVQGKCYVLK